MELSALQIVTTVVLIVAAGAVALFCDYLRNRSQQLHELAVELNVPEAMSGSAALPLMRPSAASASAARIARTAPSPPAPIPNEAPAPVAELPAPPSPRPDSPERHSTEMVKPALASAAELTSVRGSTRPRRRPAPPADAHLPRLDDMNPRQALSEWLDQRSAKVAPKRTEPAETEPLAAHPEPVEEVMAAEPPQPVAVVTPAPALAPVVANDLRDVMRRVIAKRHLTALANEEAPEAAPLVEAVSVVADEPVTGTAPVEELVPPDAVSVIEPLQAADPWPIAAVPVVAEAALPIAEAAPVEELAPAEAVAVVEALSVVEDTPVIEVAPEPAAAAPARPVSLFLSTRRIHAVERDAPANPAAHARETAPAEPRFEVIDGAGASSNSHEVVLPGGMHDRAALERAIATGKPFRGLLVSIGVNDVEGRSSRNNDLLQSIGFFIRGLLGEKEFACRNGDAEFLIACPGVEGPGAQRRLNHLAEQLWDYQLRGASTWSILFSWGGIDVHHERFSEAIAMANEQMNQTRRGRKIAPVDSVRPWRKAM
jgi:hypothetical protein